MLLLGNTSVRARIYSCREGSQKERPLGPAALSVCENKQGKSDSLCGIGKTSFDPRSFLVEVPPQWGPCLFSGQCTNSLLTENGQAGIGIRAEIMGKVPRVAPPDSNAPGRRAMNCFALSLPLKLR